MSNAASDGLGADSVQARVDRVEPVELLRWLREQVMGAGDLAVVDQGEAERADAAAMAVRGGDPSGQETGVVALLV